MLGPDLAGLRYPHVRRIVFEMPWAILPSTFDAITEFVLARAQGERWDDEEVQARIAGGPGRKMTQSSGSVAVIPIYGVIAPRATLMTQISGGTSLQEFCAALSACAADPSIGSILLDVNSPGGSVDLVPETAAAIRAARQAKPVVAVANTMAASAAYWLASQADELVVSPSGSVGSIGVFMSHDDYSEAMKMQGLKTTLISAGRFKTEGNPYGPLTDEAASNLQAMVDDFYSMFVADVAKGRGTTPDAVASGFGEGRMVLGSRSVAAGMADRVDTFDATLARMMQKGAKGSLLRAEVQHPESETEREQQLLAQITRDLGRANTSLKEAPSE